MKIIFITSKLNFLTAGSSIYEFDLTYRTLMKMGHEVSVVTLFTRDNKIPKPLPYKVLEENVMARGLIGVSWGIYKVLKKYEYDADVLHVDGHSCLYGAGLYKILGGKTPVAAYFNRELICWPANVSKMLKQKKDNIIVKIKKKARWDIEKYLGMFLASRLDWMAFTNPHLQKEYEKFGLKTASKNMILGDPFDYQTIMKEQGISEDACFKKAKTDRPLNIFYSSRMAPGKGFDMLLAAFARVKNKEKFNLILGGDGPERALLMRQAEELGIKDYVKFPGWVEKQQVFDFYKQADIFCQPYWRRELTSISLLEAMTFGLPSVLPAGGGLEWDAKKSALYFKDQDIGDLAEKIEQLGNDRELRLELSRQCYARLKEDEMNYEKKIAELYRGYEKISGKKIFPIAKY